jgi:hypothetical protein
MEAAVVRGRLLADRTHQGYERRLQLGEQRAHRSRGHALVELIDQRIGDVVIRREEVSVAAAQLERLLEERPHRGKVVGRARARPGIVRGGAERIDARDMLRRHPDRLLEIAPCDPDQSRVIGVIRQAISMRDQLVDQPSERGIDRPFMRAFAQQRALARPRESASRRHVGGLIPFEQRARRAEIGNLAEPRLELGELGFHRAAVALARRRLRLASRGPASLCFAGLGLADLGLTGLGFAGLGHRTRAADPPYSAACLT